MKFVAKVPFHNAKVINLNKKENKLEDDLHIHKGCTFELGEPAKSLKGVASNETKELISLLVLQGFVIVDDGTPESTDAIAAVKAEVEKENAAAKAKAEKEPVSTADQISALQSAVMKLTEAVTLMASKK